MLANVSKSTKVYKSYDIFIGDTIVGNAKDNTASANMGNNNTFSIKITNTMTLVHLTISTMKQVKKANFKQYPTRLSMEWIWYLLLFSHSGSTDI